MEMPYSLRQLDPIDIKSVQEIERAIFPTLWPRTPFKKELKNKMAKYLVAYATKNAQNNTISIPNESKCISTTAVLAKLTLLLLEPSGTICVPIEVLLL